MTDAAKHDDIEDVLSSIRRLVADGRAAEVQDADQENETKTEDYVRLENGHERLVLTQALRVADPEDPYQSIRTPNDPTDQPSDEAVAPEAETGLSDANEVPDLTSTEDGESALAIEEEASSATGDAGPENEDDAHLETDVTESEVASSIVVDETDPLAELTEADGPEEDAVEDHFDGISMGGFGTTAQVVQLRMVRSDEAQDDDVLSHAEPPMAKDADQEVPADVDETDEFADAETADHQAEPYTTISQHEHPAYDAQAFAQHDAFENEPTQTETEHAAHSEDAAVGIEQDRAAPSDLNVADDLQDHSFEAPGLENTELEVEEAAQDGRDFESETGDADWPQVDSTAAALSVAAARQARGETALENAPIGPETAAPFFASGSNRSRPSRISLAEPTMAPDARPEALQQSESDLAPASCSIAADSFDESSEDAQMEGVIDEDVLREIIREVVREELQGALGQRITRNVRKMVRREIRLALSAESFD